MKKIEISEEIYNKLKDQILVEEGKTKEKCEKKFEIKNRFTGNIIYSSSKTTFKDVVEEATNKGADLGGADLRCADLGGADLGGADLRGAELEGAYLGGADLRCADLGGADLGGAELEGAYLGGADLRDVNLRDADFYNVKFYGRGGSTKIKKNQVDDFFKALGIIIEE